MRRAGIRAQEIPVDGRGQSRQDHLATAEQVRQRVVGACGVCRGFQASGQPALKPRQSLSIKPLLLPLLLQQFGRPELRQFGAGA